MGEKNLDEVGQDEAGGRGGAGEGGGREIRMRVLVSRTGFGERSGGRKAARQFDGRVLACTCILYVIVRYYLIQFRGLGQFQFLCPKKVTARNPISDKESMGGY